jgi:hypothetical protein
VYQITVAIVYSLPAIIAVPDSGEEKSILINPVRKRMNLVEIRLVITDGILLCVNSAMQSALQCIIVNPVGYLEFIE